MYSIYLKSQYEKFQMTEKILNYLTVLDAQRTYLNSQLNFISLRAELLNNYVYLYKALGGGWEGYKFAEDVNLNKIGD